MPIDFYLRIEGDPKFSNTELEVEDDVDNFIQQIEMLLTTRKGDVLGEPGLGVNLEDNLWNLRIGSNQIKSSILSQIETYCNEYTAYIPYDIDVNFIKGEIYDSILVDVIINSEKVLGIAVRP